MSYKHSCYLRVDGHGIHRIVHWQARSSIVSLGFSQDIFIELDTVAVHSLRLEMLKWWRPWREWPACPAASFFFISQPVGRCEMFEIIHFGKLIISSRGLSCVQKLFTNWKIFSFIFNFSPFPQLKLNPFIETWRDSQLILLLTYLFFLQSILSWWWRTHHHHLDYLLDLMVELGYWPSDTDQNEQSEKIKM